MEFNYFILVVFIMVITSLIISSTAISGNIDFKENSIDVKSLKLNNGFETLVAQVESEKGFTTDVNAQISRDDLKHLIGHGQEAVLSGAHTVAGTDGISIKSITGNYINLRTPNIPKTYSIILPETLPFSKGYISIDDQGVCTLDTSVTQPLITGILPGTDNSVVANLRNATSINIITDANDMTLTSANDMTLTSGNDMTLASANDMTLTSANNSITMSSANGMTLTSANGIDINSGPFTLDGSTVSIDSTDNSNLTMTANDAVDKTLTISATNAGSGAGNIVIDADDINIGSNATTINIGDLNTEVTTSTLHINADNEIFFADNGKIRSRDDNHSIVFDRENDIFNINEYGDIKFNGGIAGVTNRMIIKQNGNVGIGAGTPSIKLAIGDDDTGFHQNGDGDLRIYTNGYERIRIDSDGNVGIGTSNPSIDIAIGDSDTGFKYTRDGMFDIYSNNEQRIRIGYFGASSTFHGSEPGDVHIRSNTNEGTTQPLQNAKNNHFIFTLNTKDLFQNSSGTLDDCYGLGFFGMAFNRNFGEFNFDLDIFMRERFDYDDGGTLPTGYKRIHQIGTFENDTVDTSQFFTGQHRNILNNSIDESSVGLIVSVTDRIINADGSTKPSINETLPFCEITTIDNDKAVLGVLSDKEDENDIRKTLSGTYKTISKKKYANERRMFINSLGEGALWVCNKNGSLEIGDYVSSCTVPGYGAKQILESGTLKNYTVAKLTHSCDFSLTKVPKQRVKYTNLTETITRNIEIVTQETETEDIIEFDEDLQRYVSKTITKTKNVRENVYDEFDLYDEEGNIIGTHKVPRKEEMQISEKLLMELDDNGDPIFEDDLDEDGNQQLEYPLETRFLLPDGTILADEDDYNTRLANGEEVYIACFVGCTYHCG